MIKERRARYVLNMYIIRRMKRRRTSKGRKMGLGCGGQRHMRKATRVGTTQRVCMRRGEYMRIASNMVRRWKIIL
jgi:hypothetical protein